MESYICSFLQNVIWNGHAQNNINLFKETSKNNNNNQEA